MVEPSGLRRCKTALPHSPCAGRGSAQREFPKLQRTNCLSPELQERAPSKGNIAVERRSVKSGALREKTFTAYKPLMPELSRFFGIIIRMYAEAGEPHHTA